MKLKHYYHIYANGRWEVPFNEHLVALRNSELLSNLDFIGVGIVGTKINRDKVKKSLPDNFNVVSEGVKGWEQVTLLPLSRDIEEPSKILYAHTKGAAHNSHNQPSWRREMTAGVVGEWSRCVELLDSYSAVGCRWRRDPWRHFSGNFWWATSSYISTLSPVFRVYRDNAEAWVGQNYAGGTHVEIDPFRPDHLEVHLFGRTFVSQKSITGHYTQINLGDQESFLPGDEYVGLPTTEANRMISKLLRAGASYSLRGNTVIIDNITGVPGFDVE